MSTSDGQDINVATKVDAFVYNTLAQWYNEDQAAAGSNQTLPAAPSGQQPPPAGTSTTTFLGVPADWTNPAFVAVRILLDRTSCSDHPCTREYTPIQAGLPSLHCHGRRWDVENAVICRSLM